MVFEGEFGERSGTRLVPYRLYFLDSVDRLISGSVEFEAASDGAAIAIAESMRETRPAELWSGPRKLNAWASSSQA